MTGLGFSLSTLEGKWVAGKSEALMLERLLVLLSVERFDCLEWVLMMVLLPRVLLLLLGTLMLLLLLFWLSLGWPLSASSMINFNRVVLTGICGGLSSNVVEGTIYDNILWSSMTGSGVVLVRFTLLIAVVLSDMTMSWLLFWSYIRDLIFGFRIQFQLKDNLYFLFSSVSHASMSGYHWFH